MRRTCAMALALGISLLTVACSDAPPPAPPDTRAADEKAIRDGEVAWNADLKNKDVDKVVNHYADDALLMSDGITPAKGKDAIRAVYKEMLADKNLSLTFAPDTVEVSKASDIAYSQGTYSLTATNPKTKKPATEHGEYVTVYHKEAGGFWKAVRDIDTPSARPAPVAAAKPAKAKSGRRRR